MYFVCDLRVLTSGNTYLQGIFCSKCGAKNESKKGTVDMI